MDLPITVSMGLRLGARPIGRRIFLAHACEDKPQVRKLYADLQARGLKPWLDEADLVAGQNWHVEISQVIREATAFLAFFSSNSVDKVGYVQSEFRLALSALGERPPGSVWFIPVRLDECVIPDLQLPDRGLSLRDIHWVDLWRNDGFERLIAAVEHAVGASNPRKDSEQASPVAILSALLKDHSPFGRTSSDIIYLTWLRLPLEAEIAVVLRALLAERDDPVERYWLYLTAGRVGGGACARLLQEGLESETLRFPRRAISEALQIGKHAGQDKE